MLVIILAFVRFATLLAQLQREDFQTRTSTQPCLGWRNSSIARLNLLVYRGELDPAKTPASERARFNFSISVQSASFLWDIDYNATFEWESDRCTTNSSLYIPRWQGTTLGNTTDRFDVYKCPRYLDNTEFPEDHTIRINIEDRENDLEDPLDAWDSDPRIWLTTDEQHFHNKPFGHFVPFLVPALRPVSMKHVVAEVNHARRRFIVSSGIVDALTGSKPTYQDVDLYPLTPLTSRNIPKLQNSSAGRRTSFSTITLMHSQELWDSSPGATEMMLSGESRQILCEVTEDYRLNTGFDILASIGGFLAFFQGVHIFLFGRPLLWGMFGAKLVTPFGIMGRMATANFRQRLRDHYHNSNPREPEDGHEDDINMNRFLLDYVIDLGPAAPAPQHVKDGQVPETETRHSREADKVPESNAQSRVSDSVSSQSSTLPKGLEEGGRLDAPETEAFLPSERLPEEPRRLKLSEHSTV